MGPLRRACKQPYSPSAVAAAVWGVVLLVPLAACKGCRGEDVYIAETDLLELAGCEEITVYLDQDGDGFGDPGTAVRSCDAPASATDNALDCDDQDTAVSPAQEAVCADNVDNDCDGEPDCPGFEHKPGLGTATAVMVDQYQSSLGDGMAIADLTGDGVRDLLLGSSSADDGEHYGRVHLVAGPVMGEIDLSSNAVSDISSDEDYRDGEFVAAGDLDGDNYADLVMGIVSADRDENGVYIVPGPVVAEYHLDTDDPTYLSLPFAEGESGSYSKVQTADIYDGDGQLDLLLDVVRDNGGNGSAFMMPGPIQEGGSVYDHARTALYGVIEDESVGVNNVDLVGDINGDGVNDVAAMFALEALYLTLDLPEGTFNIADIADVVIESDRHGLGEQFFSPGDVDGDGLDDLLTTPADPIDVYWGDSTSVYLFSSGTLNAATGGPTLDDDEANTAIFDGGSYSQIGMGMASPGDLNEDGYSDVFIGDPESAAGDGDHSEGYASLWYGPLEGTLERGQADVIIRGAEIGSRTGWRVAASPRDAQNNAILLVGAWPVFGDSTIYQFTPDGY